MKNTYKLLCTIVITILVSFLFVPKPASADTTYVSGLLIEQYWTAAGSPYVVTGDILVAGLTIDPGVSVLFDGNYEFEVQGKIEAIGTEQSPIILTTKSGVASWKGILFFNSSPGSIMKWCIVEKANNSGIRIIESLPKFFNCTFRNNTATPSGGGMYISNTISGQLVVNQSIFENNLASKDPGNAEGGGLYISSGTVILSKCKFSKNIVSAKVAGNAYADGGAIASEFSNILIENCDIRQNEAIATNTFGCCSGNGFARGGGVFINAGTAIIKNSIISYDTASSYGPNPAPRGGGIFLVNTGIGQTLIENSTIVGNSNHGIYKDGSGDVRVINSIVYFNNNNGSQITGAVNVTYSDVQGGFTGSGNISFSPILDACLKIVPGSQCIDAGSDSIIYNDECFPPSLGGVRNDMGAYGGPGACDWLCLPDSCSNWPVLSISVELIAFMEGLYNPVTNVMSRPQIERLYLRNVTAPYDIVESAAGTVNQNGTSTDFVFNATPSGTYYLVAKNWNCLETWSKVGGRILDKSSTNYTYNFSTDSTRAYGNNLKLIDESPLRFGFYSGDVDQNGSINLLDNIAINNESIFFASGYKVTDLNGDYITDLTDLLIASNNASNFVAVIRP